MHIPDGYLSPQTYVPFWGASIVCWSVALRKVKEELSTKQVPYLAMAAAFSFLIQMFNIPIPGGTTGHTVGAGIIAILLGPWTAVLAVSVVLIIQAIVFGDGGITAIGANCFNMAVVIPFVSYWIFKLINGKSLNGIRSYVAAFLSGYIGLSVAAIVTSIEFRHSAAHSPRRRRQTALCTVSSLHRGPRHGAGAPLPLRHHRGHHYLFVAQVFSKIRL